MNGPSECQGFTKPWGYRPRVCKGKGKGTKFWTLHKPLPLGKGRRVSRGRGDRVKYFTISLFPSNLWSQHISKSGLGFWNRYWSGYKVIVLITNYMYNLQVIYKWYTLNSWRPTCVEPSNTHVFDHMPSSIEHWTLQYTQVESMNTCMCVKP